jgi:hypothetical protein
MRTDINLSDIVHKYVQGDRRQAELEWFRRQQNLELAIRFAALANINGKRHQHQYRLKEVALKQAQQILLSESKAIAQSKDFDDLFIQIETVCQGIRGLGPLYVYDTSLRIGAKLNLLPGKVYLHAGTWVGARNLGLDSKAKALEISQMPPELGKLEAYEIEDVLCIYKNDLMGKGSKYKKDSLIKRSRCC